MTGCSYGETSITGRKLRFALGYSDSFEGYSVFFWDTPILSRGTPLFFWDTPILSRVTPILPRGTPL